MNKDAGPAADTRDMQPDPEYPGNPTHPLHNEYLQELGAATYEAAGVAGIMVDLLRVHHGAESFDLTNLDLGKLVRALRDQIPTSSVPGLQDFVDKADQARIKRNDLIHSLPVAHGLHRRTKADRGRVVNFFTVEDVHALTAELRALRTEGNRLLYFDGGAAVRAWEAQPPPAD